MVKIWSRVGVWAQTPIKWGLERWGPEGRRGPKFRAFFPLVSAVQGRAPPKLHNLGFSVGPVEGRPGDGGVREEGGEGGTSLIAG